jgi:hypothetical protein
MLNMNLKPFIESQIADVLEPGERLLWSGAPDQRAMVRGSTASNQLVAGLAIPAVAAAAAAVLRDTLVAAWAQAPLAVLIPSSFIAFFAGLSLLRWRRFRRYAASLAYGLTDRRLLILRNGAVDRETSPGEVKHVERQDRRRAPGFSDLIWERLPPPSSSSGGAVRNLDPVRRERLEVGLKALANGEEVLERIRAWRRGHEENAAEQARSFVESAGSSGGTATAAGRTVRHPALGFRLGIPDGWSVQVRRRRLAFGQTGIEKRQPWSRLEEATDWNVLRVANALDATVEVQVHEIEPQTTHDDVVGSRAARLLAIEPVASERHVEINGIPGFSVTRRLGPETGGPLGANRSSVAWLQREWVLHDGRRQLYVTATWPESSPGQGTVCEAVVSTLRAD